MVRRTSWVDRIESAWRHRSVVWLMGVRRVGKSVLCQSLRDCEYFDCELPRVRRLLEDPESFLRQHRGKRVVLDEVHRLPNPSELLKIAADHFPTARILATGSSTLGASARFRDTLTGRKAEVWLTPMTLADLVDFGNEDLPHRLLHGGLPPFFDGGRRRPPARQDEVDLVAVLAAPVVDVPRAQMRMHLVECKWRAVDLDAASLRAFRGAYPGGANYVVASDVDRPITRRYGDLTVRCVSPAQLIDDVTRPHRKP